MIDLERLAAEYAERYGVPIHVIAPLPPTRKYPGGVGWLTTVSPEACARYGWTITATIHPRPLPPAK